MLALQAGHVHKLGCLSDTCSTAGIDEMGVYVGEVEAIMHAKGAAVAIHAHLPC